MSRADPSMTRFQTSFRRLGTRLMVGPLGTLGTNADQMVELVTELTLSQHHSCQIGDQSQVQAGASVHPSPVASKLSSIRAQ